MSGQRWKWQRDWAGFSGPLWPTETKRSQFGVLGIYGCGYFIDACLPLLGDLRVGFYTKGGMRNPHIRAARRLVLTRAPWPKRTEATP